MLSDDPARLRAWQRRFGEQPPASWQVAVPGMRDVDAINAAAQVLRERSYAAASLFEVAKAAGVTPGAAGL